MKKDIMVTIAQGTLKGTEEEGMMTFYRIPYGTNAGRFHEVGAAPTWEGTRDASEPGPVFPQNKSRLSSVLGNPHFKMSDFLRERISLRLRDSGTDGSLSGSLRRPQILGSSGEDVLRADRTER